MKLRLGFVSNSSSSSFIVKNIDPFPLQGEDKHPKLTQQEITKLLEYGFFPIKRRYPSELEISHGEYDNMYTGRDNFGYYVIVNQDEVIDFLIKNKISFVAATQYGHEHVFYNRDTDELVFAQNYGNHFEMYGVDQYLKDKKNHKWTTVSRKYITITTGKAWLEGDK